MYFKFREIDICYSRRIILGLILTGNPWFIILKTNSYEFIIKAKKTKNYFV